MKNGHSRIYLECSENIHPLALTKFLEALSGSSRRVLDFTLIRLPTQSYIVVSIGEPETLTLKRYSAVRLVKWFYNPSPLLRFYHFPTAGVPGWISLSTLRQVLRQRIVTRRVIVRESYPIRLWYHRQAVPNMLGRGMAKEWRGFIATIHRIHARTYYG